MKTIHMIGNAHIDPIWLWQWREGYQEIKATFQSALDRLAETPDFVFTCACADYYLWIEENAPDMFEQIRMRVQEGRWKIVGGMWIQPDCNMPSGESFARHLTYSIRYFKEKFGITVKTGYNVDSFGHTGMLPQLLSRAGVENYVFLRPGKHENAAIPAPLFKWTSLDGSEVTAFRIGDDGYGSRFGDCSVKIDRAFEVANESGFPVMCFYGVGNHGGGPTIQNIKSVIDYQQNKPRGNEVVFSSPDAYFDYVKEAGLTLPIWNTELQHHASGCYSACSMIKRLNRRTEGALTQSEIFASMANKLVGHSVNKDAYLRGWKNLMFNQFHDVLCGCSILEAYDDVQQALGESLSIAAREENAALQRLSWRVDTMKGHPGRKNSKESDWGLWEIDGLGTPVVVFNPHPFEATGSVLIKRPIARVTDDDGVEVPAQIVRASRTNGRDKWDSIFEATVPALGYRLYWIYLKRESEAEAIDSGLSITETSIENKYIRAEFDSKTGALISLVEKTTGREVICAPAQAKLIDVEHCDTWAHAIFTFDKDVGTFENAEFAVLERGPVRVSLRVTTHYNDSTLVQDYRLYPESKQLDVDACLNLNEKFRHVKLCFPVHAESPVARAEIAYGIIERVPNGEEETCQRWMQLGDEVGGLGVLNDGKYSFCAKGNELRLTVANSSIYADHYGQETRDELCRFLDQGEQHFCYALVPHTGDWRGAELSRRGALLNQPFTHVVESYHAGELPAAMQGIAIGAKNIAVGAIKRSEDETGYIIRFHESDGLPTQTCVDVKLFGRHFELNFAPCEVKTVLLPDCPDCPIQELMLTEYVKEA